MVAFNDRRPVALSDPKEAPGLSSGSGVFLSRKVINDRFLVSSSSGPLIEGSRMYAVHEVLPNGETVTRSDGHPTRYAAQKSAREMTPTHVREILG